MVFTIPLVKNLMGIHLNDIKEVDMKRKRGTPMKKGALKLQLTKKTAIKSEDVRKAVAILEANLGRLSEFSIIGGDNATVTAQNCGSHSCSGVFDDPPEQPNCPGLGFCDTEACDDQSCSGHACDTNSCDNHACRDENFDCVEHSSKFLDPFASSSSSWGQVLSALSDMDTWSGISIQSGREL